MKVLFFETTTKGHTLRYLRLALRGLFALPVKVVISLPEFARDSVEFRTFLGDAPVNVIFDFFPCAAIEHVGIRSAFRRVALCEAAVQRHKPDLVFLTSVDRMTEAAVAGGLWKRSPLTKVATEVCYHRLDCAYPRQTLSDLMKAEATKAALKRAPWGVMHQVDALAYQYLLDHHPDLAARVDFLPDPVDIAPSVGRQAAMQLLGLPTQRRYLGCAGALSFRHGVDLLTNAFVGARLGPEVSLILAGQMQPQLLHMIQERYPAELRSGKIIVIDRFLTPMELGAVLDTIDLFCAFYNGHVGISSMVLNAAQAGRPVLGCSFGWIGRAIEAFDLGWTCDVGKSESLAANLAAAFHGAGTYRAGTSARRLLRLHLPEVFANALLRRVRRQLGLSSHEHGEDREWVIERFRRAGHQPAGASPSAQG